MFMTYIRRDDDNDFILIASSAQRSISYHDMLVLFNELSYYILGERTMRSFCIMKLRKFILLIDVWMISWTCFHEETLEIAIAIYHQIGFPNIANMFAQMPNQISPSDPTKCPTGYFGLFSSLVEMFRNLLMMSCFIAYDSLIRFFFRNRVWTIRDTCEIISTTLWLTQSISITQNFQLHSNVNYDVTIDYESIARSRSNRYFPSKLPPNKHMYVWLGYLMSNETHFITQQKYNVNSPPTNSWTSKYGT